eukprot:SAG31_NODE_16147_length_721_cov_1.009646_1_plen_178_part_10
MLIWFVPYCRCFLLAATGGLVSTEPYRCEVHSFDPTPTGKEHIAKLRNSGDLPARMSYHELGIAHFDGEVSLYKSQKTQHDKGRQYTREATSGRNGDSPNTVTFPVKRISSVMQRLGHSYIDMLKIDTEGGEFEDVLGLSEDGVLDRVGAFCAEFHYYSVYESTSGKGYSSSAPFKKV